MDPGGFAQLALSTEHGLPQKFPSLQTFLRPFLIVFTEVALQLGFETFHLCLEQATFRLELVLRVPQDIVAMLEVVLLPGLIE